MENIVTQRKCTKCGELRDLSEFYNQANCNLNLTTRCKQCSKDYNISYYIKNKEKIKNKSRIDYSKNRSTIIGRITKRYKENPHIIKERVKKWRAENMDKKLVYDENRRLQKMSNGGTITAIEWEELKDKYGNKCLRCGKTNIRLSLDHVIPLSKGGKHTIGNSQPLCRSCNSKKHTKSTDYRIEV